MKCHIFGMFGVLAINALSVTMTKMTELIGFTYRNGRDVKRCL